MAAADSTGAEPAGGASRLPYLWMLLGCVAFACMGELVHALRSACDWRLIALARSFLSLLFAAWLALAAGKRLVLWRPRSLWMRSTAGGISLVCTFFALTRLPVSDVLTLTNTFPLWVAVLSWPLLGQRPTAGVWLAVLCGVAGAVLVQQPHLAAGNIAAVLALGAAVATAVAMIGLHRLEGVDTWPIVAHFGGVATLFCLAALLAPVHTDAPDDTPGTLMVLLLLGVGLTATCGQFFLTRAFAVGTPAKVSVVGLSQVVLAMGLDMLLWQRSFSPCTLLGVALVLVPAAWVMARGEQAIRFAPVPDDGRET
jgi:drug/metabolite transporter (DMT)-like permease